MKFEQRRGTIRISVLSCRYTLVQALRKLSVFMKTECMYILWCTNSTLSNKRNIYAIKKIFVKMFIAVIFLLQKTKSPSIVN